MASQNSRWSREELLIAFNLYCQMPFGKMHSRNPRIVQVAEVLGRSPSSVSMKLVNFASLDPSITSTGRTGLGNASQADKAMWNEFNGDWERLAVESEEQLRSLAKRRTVLLAELEDETLEADYEGKTRTAQVQVRIKQSFFRKMVLSSYGGRCCITQISEPRLLVASHIVPWQTDAKNRLNPRNGLCLSALHDRAFDCGLITITKNFCVDVSASLRKAKNEPFIRDTLIAVHGKQIRLPEKFRPDLEFLERHREMWKELRA